ncbi:A/G-specific adenine glycosylase [Ideonella alba]|uniref:A/G-specific adenine glycosylase n=1 Tax=Ideonella alba TaxID=2824118 RepID=UPI002873447F|nr:A/G-specific adenine glycosylase [Ideonella alba]
MSARLPDIATPLVAWQRQHGRHALPWQGTRDPYRVWLSEIMLQQTQVSTVLGYYERFLQRFPDVAALAAAPQDDVLTLWAGLGYYSRARNLHRCAQQVVAQHGGAFPRSAQALQDLPGIGRSTAAAIAAFCWDERVPILDGNVKRVLTRVLAFEGDLAETRVERALWAQAQDLLPAQGQDMPAYTQGLMDLGATLCSQRQPRCADCPLQAHCRARAEDRTAEFPRKTRKLKRSRVALTWLWLRRADGAHWLLPRPARGVWAGLWSLPECADAADAQAAVQGWTGTATPGETFTHVLTHRDMVITPWQFRFSGEAPSAEQLQHRWPGGRWVASAELDAVGLPAPLTRLLRR